MTFVETVLYGICSALATFVLATTWIGHERGAYEMNPIARLIFETLRRYTGSWASMLIFIPIVVSGVYIAARLIARDLKNYPHAMRTTFIAFILLILPATLHESFIVKLSIRISLLLSFVPLGLFLILEWVRWQRVNK